MDPVTKAGGGSPETEDASAHADALAARAESLHAAGSYAEAEPLARDVLRIRATSGAAAALRFRAIERLAALLSRQGRDDEARALYEGELAAFEAAYGPGDVGTAQVMTELGRLLGRQGDTEAARPLFERALAVFRAVLEPGHPLLATGLNNLGAILLDAGDHDEARVRFEGALGIYTARGESPPPGVIANLAEALYGAGDHAGARVRLEQALAAFEAAGEPMDLAVTPVLSSLGALAFERAEYASARAFFERAIAIQTAARGPDDFEVARHLNNLGAVLDELGDFERALELYRRALSIQERSLGPSNVHVAHTLANLAWLLEDMGDHGAALDTCRRALEIHERVLGPEHELTAHSVNNLALLHLMSDDYAAARPLAERALAIWERTPGAGHHVATACHNLAVILESQGDRPAARALYGRAIDAWRTALGPQHPDTALALYNLGTLDWELGDLPAAHDGLRQAASVLDRHAATVLFTLSPAEQRGFVELALNRLTSPFLSLMDASRPAAVLYGAIAGWKGLLLEGLRRQAAIRALATDPILAGDVAALEAVRTQVAHAFGTGDSPVVLAGLEGERERLERNLSVALPPWALHDPWSDAGEAAFTRLRRALSDGSAFVDLYQHVRWEGGTALDWRYTGVVTSAGTPPVRVDLGPSAELEAAVDAWRRARTRPNAPTAALAARLWSPLAAALPAGTERVWVAPDGALARVPWGTLAQAASSTATVRPLVAQVPSARALLRLLVDQPHDHAGDVLVVGGVDFGHAPGGGRDRWVDLPATAREVRRVAAAARAAGLGVRRLTCTSATPAAVARGVRTAAYLHLATHGFFGGESRAEYKARQAAAVQERGLRSGPLGTATPSGRSPLSASGLALAGANAGPQGNLTAEEIVGLSLDGARLVVLSACDTGRGAEVTGQGVLGLQAAVQAAGARALLMSLWPVPDAATAELMVTFYRQLWKHARSPAEALLDAQAALRDGGVWPEPVFWAGWSLVGDAFSVAPRSTPPAE